MTRTWLSEIYPGHDIAIGFPTSALPEGAVELTLREGWWPWDDDIYTVHSPYGEYKAKFCTFGSCYYVVWEQLDPILGRKKVIFSNYEKALPQTPFEWNILHHVAMLKPLEERYPLQGQFTINETA